MKAAVLALTLVFLGCEAYTPQWTSAEVVEKQILIRDGFTGYTSYEVVMLTESGVIIVTRWHIPFYYAVHPGDKVSVANAKEKGEFLIKTDHNVIYDTYTRQVRKESK